jgi:putative transposase
VITQVHQHLPERAITGLCELLQVSRSWYYEKQTRPKAAEADVELRDMIERIILDFPGYGYRRVTHALKRAGRVVNHKRVLRIMREESSTQPIKATLCAYDGLAASLSDLSQFGERDDD